MTHPLTFSSGGVHPPQEKGLTDPRHYTVLPNPQTLTLALAQHLGAPAKPIVSRRDNVESGQLIGEASGFVSAHLHAPLKGTVQSLAKVHMGPLTSLSIALKVDHDAAPLVTFEPDPPVLDLNALEGADIIRAVKSAGLVGMGGAAFPTHVKLSPPPGVAIDTVVINAAECEPYLTADDCLMRNHPVQVLEGTRALVKATGVERAVIGIEDNKPEAYRLLNQLAQDMPLIDVKQVKTRYPQGSEKHLIEALTGRRVPPGKLPFTVGVVVQNVSTAAAVYEAVQFQRPLIRRLISVSGRAVAYPQDVLVPLGATISDVLQHCGGLRAELSAIILGGPMMGRSTVDINEPVTKGTSGILFLTQEEVEAPAEEPCIRCGSCIRACPMGLEPTLLATLARRNRFAEAQDALDCIECGSCAYICPANIRLVHLIRLAKWELNRMRRRAQQRKTAEEQASAVGAKQ